MESGIMTRLMKIQPRTERAEKPSAKVAGWSGEEAVFAEFAVVFHSRREY